MYIITNGQTYPSVRVLSTPRSVQLLGESLTGLTELTGSVTVYADNGFEMQIFAPADYARQEIKDGSWLLTNAAAPQTVAEPVEYDLTVSTANAVRLLLAGKQPETADEIIQCSALWPEWEEGVHAKDDIYTVSGDPWVCLAGYDNAVYPDIVPGNAAWPTFNKPLHGTTRETARDFVHPTNATDIYKAGEWAVQDGKYTKANQDTAYSLAEYPQAWDVEE